MCGMVEKAVNVIHLRFNRIWDANESMSSSTDVNYLSNYHVVFDLERKVRLSFDIGVNDPVSTGAGFGAELCRLHLFNEGVEYWQLIQLEPDVDIEVNLFPGSCLHRDPFANGKVD